ncbi:uncharacterized protein B0H18DRAFT_1214541 [Fomitopsis serialis]|uniref:uncharacterized protein n=1 Tax=Fomitopsis serialis TaxID=139415 RepID=UPI0020080153|nr:uncharacterized protein B0H18DRAFT_1214541 [Neoantrodia serialis]KAH9917533.1 hypothetical protein B0H18DRAFT_1214541 [Neoantrodia serialis]
MPHGDVYLGTTRKLVLAIDVGTTYSGVSFCVLDPGKVPEVHSVIRYPGQEGENKARDTKIPSVLYYDEDGEVRAAGAEAVSDGTLLEAEEQEWNRAEWFKLRLCPEGMQAKGERLPKICIDKSVVQIFADYLAYIYKCAKDYISDSHALGRQVLETGAPIEFVLSHPNGWGGKQQSKMRHAAILAGLVPDMEAGNARICFVSEGEASLHFCIVNGLVGESLKDSQHIMVVDAGGGTVDLSTYKIVKTMPLNVVESSAADCLLQGSTLVNNRARIFLEDKLKDSRFANDDFVNSMLESFESSAKPTFRDTTKTSYVKFGGPRDNDDKCGIKRGVLALSGAEMLHFFRPSIDAIQRAIQRQLYLSGRHISVILLVGGFAGSPFLRAQLQAFARQNDLVLFFPEHQTAKAVAEGALWFHLENYVSARVAKHIYGTDNHTGFQSSLSEHIERRHKSFVHSDGEVVIPDAFTKIISRGTLVTEEQEFRASFIWKRYLPISRIKTSILAYRGTSEDPRWVDKETDMFSTLCHIRADIPPTCWKSKTGKLGDYFSACCDVILLFGLTELKAQLCWVENGQECRWARHHYSLITVAQQSRYRSQAVIVYDDESS